MEGASGRRVTRMSAPTGGRALYRRPEASRGCTGKNWPGGRDQRFSQRPVAEATFRSISWRSGSAAALSASDAVKLSSLAL
jgi:hypothetical protein